MRCSDSSYTGPGKSPPGGLQQPSQEPTPALPTRTCSTLPAHPDHRLPTSRATLPTDSATPLPSSVGCQHAPRRAMGFMEGPRSPLPGLEALGVREDAAEVVADSSPAPAGQILAPGMQLPNSARPASLGVREVQADLSKLVSGFFDDPRSAPTTAARTKTPDLHFDPRRDPRSTPTSAPDTPPRAKTPPSAAKPPRSKARGVHKARFTARRPKTPKTANVASPAANVGSPYVDGSPNIDGSLNVDGSPNVDGVPDGDGSQAAKTKKETQWTRARTTQVMRLPQTPAKPEVGHFTPA
ncbi:hypothetical protein T484DRAFT_1931144 [Baffinella frigidus]|nr:hypothetical protein T484DRAFT_1931144 [Cryptophyta sp. CCMP2293]